MYDFHSHSSARKRGNFFFGGFIRFNRVVNARFFGKGEFLFGRVDQNRHALIIYNELRYYRAEYRSADYGYVLSFFDFEFVDYGEREFDKFDINSRFVFYALRKREHVRRGNDREIFQESVFIFTCDRKFVTAFGMTVDAMRAFPATVHRGNVHPRAFFEVRRFGGQFVDLSDSGGTGDNRIFNFVVFGEIGYYIFAGDKRFGYAQFHAVDIRQKFGTVCLFDFFFRRYLPSLHDYLKKICRSANSSAYII